VDRNDPCVTAFLQGVEERSHERFRKLRSEKQVVRNAAADRLNLLSSWGGSSLDRPGREIHYSLVAYLEFVQPADFNLAGRLAGEDHATDDNGTPISVLPKDQSITVVLEHFKYVEYGDYTSDGSVSISSGTIQARVGDLVRLSCGEYRTAATEKEDFYRQGVVMALAFEPLAAYTLEPMK
jgi:hypothetical protein